MSTEFNVNGFTFTDPAEYADAKHEAQAIEYLCMKTDVTNSDVALKVYNKLIERNSFHTVVGKDFLKKLANTAGIEIPNEEAETKVSGEEETYPVKEAILVQKYRSRLLKCYIIIAGMAVVIITIFIIAKVNGTLNMKDAETKIQNEYSSWKEELDKRQDYLDSFEQELIEREKKLDEREE